ncbi:MAG: DUF2807 domain-containing protein [Bacteroidetes bacterium]|nr:DUF2807 domain-containing protein [Bacteroidota bacterium]
MKTLVIIFLLSLGFWGCEKIATGEDVISGNGRRQTETRNLQGFSSIESRISANINIYKSDSFCIRITASQNLLPYIHTSLINSSLIITTGGYHLVTDCPVTIDIYAPDIEELKLKGTGQVQSNSPLRRILLSGSGNISCSGKTEDVDVLLTGSGTIDLSAMPVNTANVKLFGTGVIKLRAKEQLDISITGVGSVYYEGTPMITQKITGIGSVVKVN